MAAVVGEEDATPRATQVLGTTAGDSLTRQQRFEDSRVGKFVISGLIAVVLLLNVVWNLPQSSPIAESLHRVTDPLAVPLGLDQWWGMFAVPESRVVSIEVDVEMADGGSRVWHMEPSAAGVGWWSRWTGLRNQVVKNQFVRPQLAHWVVRQVTTSNDRAVSVAVIMRTENVPKPGDAGGGKSPASKVLYQETLMAPR